jgi:pSer/pThr/pTyr-binding forkhead associated (FHA) protein
MPAYLKPLGKGRPVILDKPILFVARHPECDIILLNSRKVSRKHCCIALVDNAFRVRDLGSTNGVSINGARILKEGEVKVGDEVWFGDVAYRLLQGEAPSGVGQKQVHRRIRARRAIGRRRRRRVLLGLNTHGWSPRRTTRPGGGRRPPIRIPRGTRPHDVPTARIEGR